MSTPTTTDREQLHQQWRDHADALFKRLFPADTTQPTPTFDHLEQRTRQLATDLASWLLEQRLQHAADTDPAPPHPCPRCGRPGQPAPRPNAPRPQRGLTTRVGPVAFRRERWRCTTCRVVFFPSDEQLGLTQEGYSPAVIRLVSRQGAKTPFAEASDDLEALADIPISPMQVQRLCERVGAEWAAVRDRDVQAFTERQLPPTVATAPAVAAVMLDGGRVQTRAADSGRGVSDPRWQETKVACCLSLQSPKKAVDPQPKPPAKLLEPVAVARLAAELKARRSGGASPAARRSSPNAPATPAVGAAKGAAAVGANGGSQLGEQRHVRLPGGGRGATAAAGGGQTQGVRVRRAEVELVDLRVTPAAVGLPRYFGLLHLVSYLYAAAQAAASVVGKAAWALYERWLRWAWAGQVRPLLAALRDAATRLGVPLADAKEDDPRQVAAAVSYVTNNRDRMNYPEYRQLGLPISSAPVESVIKQLNRRVKGTEKFWTAEGVEAVLQLRAAYLSEDGRAEIYAARPRPLGRAVGANRLRQKG